MLVVSLAAVVAADVVASVAAVAAVVAALVTSETRELIVQELGIWFAKNNSNREYRVQYLGFLWMKESEQAGAGERLYSMHTTLL